MVSAADPQGLDFNEDDEQMDFNDVPRVSEQLHVDLDPQNQNSADQSRLSMHFEEYQLRPTIISKFDFEERESS